MNPSHEKSCDETEPITFCCAANQAAAVCLIGDFNNWSAHTHPMRRLSDGSWFLQVFLTRKRHYYQFLVDGEPVLDPLAMCVVRQDHCSKVSLIALS